MPVSSDAKCDREIFLRITMDDDDVWQRVKPAARRKVSGADFDAMTYAQRIQDCERPDTSWGSQMNDAYLRPLEKKNRGLRG
jgi:hypothetical protein